METSYIPHATEVISDAVDMRRNKSIETALQRIVEERAAGSISDIAVAQARRALARYDNDYMARGRLLDSAADILVQGKQIAQDWYLRHPSGPHVYTDPMGAEHDCNCRPYIDAYRTFLREHRARPYRPTSGQFAGRPLLHVRLIHETLRYTTEPDQVLDLDSHDEPAVLDLKTGAVPAGGELHPWGLQTAGQKGALISCGIDIGLRMVLNLRSDGSYRLYQEYQDTAIFTLQDAGAFRALLQARSIRDALGENTWGKLPLSRSA